jgi:Tfp pilus assembly protein PilF
LSREETSERWNDWAAAAFVSGAAIEAEHGFRRALELAPDDRQAAENLGLLLMEQQRFAEALPFLVRAADVGDVTGNSSILSLLEECRRQAPRWPLTAYALRLAHFGQFREALEMVTFNRHFQPCDLALAKLNACLELLVRKGGSVNA